MRKDRKKRNREITGGGVQKNNKEYDRIKERRKKKERKAEKK